MQIAHSQISKTLYQAHFGAHVNRFVQKQLFLAFFFSFMNPFMMIHVLCLGTLPLPSLSVMGRRHGVKQNVEISLTRIGQCSERDNSIYVAWRFSVIKRSEQTMNTILGKTFVNPKFLSRVVIEHSKMSLIKSETYSLSLYQSKEQGLKIYIFSQDHPNQLNPSLTIHPNRFKYGNFGNKLFLVKHKQENFKNNYFQWRFSKALASLSEVEEVLKTLPEDLQEIISNFELEKNNEPLKHLA